MEPLNGLGLRTYLMNVRMNVGMHDRTWMNGMCNQCESVLSVYTNRQTQECINRSLRMYAAAAPMRTLFQLQPTAKQQAPGVCLASVCIEQIEGTQARARKALHCNKQDSSLCSHNMMHANVYRCSKCVHALTLCAMLTCARAVFQMRTSARSPFKLNWGLKHPP